MREPHPSFAWSIRPELAPDTYNVFLGWWTGQDLNRKLYVNGYDATFGELAAVRPQHARDMLHKTLEDFMRQPFRVRSAVDGQIIASTSMDGSQATELVERQAGGRLIRPDEILGAPKLNVYQWLAFAGLRRRLGRPNLELLAVIEGPYGQHYQFYEPYGRHPRPRRQPAFNRPKS